MSSPFRVQKVKRGYARKSERTGRVGLYPGSNLGYGARRSLRIIVDDDIGRSVEDRRAGAVRLEATVHGDQVSQMLYAMAGVSTIEGRLLNAVRMGVEAQRRGEGSESAMHQCAGEARGLIVAQRLIEATGNDEMGAWKDDNARLEALWATESEKQEASSRFLDSVAAGFAEVETLRREQG